MVEQTGNIAEDLKHLAQGVGDLVLDPANLRKHNARSIDSIKASLSRFGQRKPIVVQKDGMVVRAGNGTLEAARSLGWSHVAAVVIDDDNLTATQFAIADNRTAELAEWDFEDLSSVLHELQDADVDIVGLGWSEDEVDNMIKANWEAPPVEGDGGEFTQTRNITLKFDEEQSEHLRRTLGGDVTAESVVARVIRD